jgi:hypothetical protein
LRKFFARNVAVQLANRHIARVEPSQSNPEYPPGYRPLQFRQRYP